MKAKYLQKLQSIVYQHLNPSTSTAFIFGSQAKNNHWRGSDVDLGIEGEVTAMQLTKLRESLEESTLPFTVDIVNFQEVSDTFKKTAKAKIIKL